MKMSNRGEKPPRPVAALYNPRQENPGFLAPYGTPTWTLVWYPPPVDFINRQFTL